MKKKILMILAIIVIAIILLVTNQNSVKAAEVTVEKIVTNTDGSIDYIIKGLTLEEGESYQWAIEKAQNATITNWYDVTAPEYSNGTIKISVLSTNANHLAILKATDTAYITIRKKDETTNVLSEQKVDLTLPLLKAYTVKNTGNTLKSLTAFEITGVYGIVGSNVSYKLEKISDANIVNNYIDNNHDLSGLKLKGIESFPSLSDTSWKSINRDPFGSYGITNGNLPTEDGLYYIWLKNSSTGIKTVYGQAVVEVGEVKKIQNSKDTDGNEETPKETTTEQTDDKKDNTGKVIDTTTATKILPNTGKEIVIGIVFALGVISLVIYTKCKKYKDIK